MFQYIHICATTEHTLIHNLTCSSWQCTTVRILSAKYVWHMLIPMQTNAYQNHYSTALHTVCNSYTLWQNTHYVSTVHVSILTITHWAYLMLRGVRKMYWWQKSFFASFNNSFMLTFLLIISYVCRHRERQLNKNILESPFSYDIAVGMAVICDVSGQQLRHTIFSWARSMIWKT